MGTLVAASSAFGPVFGAGGQSFATEPDSKALDLSVAGYPFEHVRGLMDGRVSARGSVINFQVGKIGDLNTHIFSGPRTIDVTEIGLIPYILAFANDDFRAYSLLPVFPLRLFRHKSIFIRTDSGIDHPEDLKGRRVGTPGYSSTSLTWIRGMLRDEYGVRPEDIEWVVSAEDSSKKDSGNASAQEQMVPDGITLTTGPAGKDESDLLLDGHVDALFHAAEPRAFIEGNPKIRRLFTDPREVERDYFARTDIFPIMHAVAVRRDLIEANPWLPEAVFNAYSAAKKVSYQAMRDKWFLRTLPWFAQELDSTRQLMGQNFWPYGIGKNRKTLETLFRYAHEQGLARQRLEIDDIFDASMNDLVES